MKKACAVGSRASKARLRKCRSNEAWRSERDKIMGKEKSAQWRASSCGAVPSPADPDGPPFRLKNSSSSSKRSVLSLGGASSRRAENTENSTKQLSVLCRASAATARANLPLLATRSRALFSEQRNPPPSHSQCACWQVLNKCAGRY